MRRRKATAKAAQPEAVRVSPSVFAKSIEVTDVAVRKAIKDGRLSKSVEQTKRGGRIFSRLDPELARSEWAANTAPRKDSGRATVSFDPASFGTPPRDTRKAPSSDDDEEEEPEPINFQAERARKERAMADRYELQNAQARACLLDRTDTERILFGLGRFIRDGLAQLAAELPGELQMSSAKDIGISLERETTLIAAQLHAEIVKLVGQDGEAAA